MHDSSIDPSYILNVINNCACNKLSNIGGIVHSNIILYYFEVDVFALSWKLRE